MNENKANGAEKNSLYIFASLNLELQILISFSKDVARRKDDGGGGGGECVDVCGGGREVAQDRVAADNREKEAFFCNV